MKKHDIFSPDKIKMLLELFRKNFSFQEEFWCDADGLSRCRKRFDSFAQVFLRDPEVLSLVLRYIGVEQSPIPKIINAFKSILLSADTIKINIPKLPTKRLRTSTVLRVAYQQYFYSLQELAKLELCLLEKDSLQAARHNIRYAIAMVNAQTGVCLVGLSLTEEPFPFAVEFSCYTEKMRHERGFTYPREFWEFLRIETQKKAIKIGTQWIQVDDGSLRHGPKEELDSYSSSVTKSTVDKYFSKTRKTK